MDPMRNKEYMERFLLKLDKLAAALDAELPQSRKVVYWERLRRYPIEVLEKALDLACDQCTWFPKLPELHRIIEQVGNPPVIHAIGPDRQVEETRCDPETARRGFAKIYEILDGVKSIPEGNPGNFEHKRETATRHINFEGPKIR